MSEAVDKLGNIVKFCYGFMTLALFFFFFFFFFFLILMHFSLKKIFLYCNSTNFLIPQEMFGSLFKLMDKNWVSCASHMGSPW
jgi:hypothetical protein